MFESIATSVPQANHRDASNVVSDFTDLDASGTAKVAACMRQNLPS
jgi:hypothetical protein